MAVGMVKFLWHGLRAGFGYTFKLENRADHLDKAIRGLGKVFFWRTFSLYGAPALRDVNSISEDEITVAPDNGQLDRLTP